VEAAKGFVILCGFFDCGGLRGSKPGAGLGDYEPGAGLVSGLRILPGIYILFDYCLIHFLPTQD